MNRIILKIALLFLTFINVFGQEIQSDLLSTLNDGPYVFIEEDHLIERSIIDGKVVSKQLKFDAYETSFEVERSIYNNIRKIAALSDIHGQYELAIKILQNNKIIDNQLNWKFGNGHLVIVGDIFDRGEQVNEMLWLVYKLEQQAEMEGGRVHFLLGNHEFMILHKDLRYIHEDYELASTLLNVEYDELYGHQTVLGRWLRSKPTMLKINDNIFVHGGISQEFLAANEFDLESVNEIMRASIDREKTEMKSTDFYKTYYGSNSLIWYRGYFKNVLEDQDVSDILNQVNSNHIVVGHCSNETIVQLFDHKIYGVDSSIKNGKYGELLLIKNNKYSRRAMNGKKKHFNATNAVLGL